MATKDESKSRIELLWEDDHIISYLKMIALSVTPKENFFLSFLRLHLHLHRASIADAHAYDKWPQNKKSRCFTDFSKSELT